MFLIFLSEIAFVLNNNGSVDAKDDSQPDPELCSRGLLATNGGLTAGGGGAAAGPGPSADLTAGSWEQGTNRRGEA